MYTDRFAWDSKLIGSNNLCKTSIRDEIWKPIHQQLYRMSHTEREIIKSKGEHLDNELIRESRSAYSRTVLLVKKTP